MAATARQYASDTRRVDGFTVHAYSILTTDTVVFDVLEVAAGHTSTIALPAGRFGHYLSRPLPADLASLPYGDERTRLVGLWHRSLDVTAQEIILTAYPEIFGYFNPGSGVLKDGHGSCDLGDFNSLVQS